MTSDNKEKSLNLLIETYKLYAAFCAIIIAGLLSFLSSLTTINEVIYLHLSIGALSLCSIFCIIGIQYFISEIYLGEFDIYEKLGAKIILCLVIILLITGMLLGFIFLTKQDKMKIKQSPNKEMPQTIRSHTS